MQRRSARAPTSARPPAHSSERANRERRRGQHHGRALRARGGGPRTRTRLSDLDGLPHRTRAEPPPAGAIGRRRQVQRAARAVPHSERGGASAPRDDVRADGPASSAAAHPARRSPVSPALALLGLSRAHFVGADEEGRVAVYQGVPWDCRRRHRLYREVYVSAVAARPSSPSTSDRSSSTTT